MNVLDSKVHHSSVVIPHGKLRLPGDLTIPPYATGLVLFAHGSGSSRHSPRNQAVARTLNEHRIGTLLFDLLTELEEEQEFYTRHLRFDIPMLADRLAVATTWITGQNLQLPVGYFGSSTGAAAAVMAAARFPYRIRAVVSRGGRPDLADEFLPNVTAPTLLIVGERDEAVVEMNRQAEALLNCEKELAIIPRATHLFEEPGTMEAVSRLAAIWFSRHFNTKPSGSVN